MDMDIPSFIPHYLCCSELELKSEQGNCSVMCKTVGKNKNSLRDTTLCWTLTGSVMSQSCRLTPPGSEADTEPQYKHGQFNTFLTFGLSKRAKLQNQWFSNTFSQSAIGAVYFNWRAEGSVMAGVQAAQTCFSYFCGVCSD